MAVLTIASRELRALFNSTIGWLVLTAFLLLNGLFFLLWLDYFASASSQFSGGAYGDVQLYLSEQLFAPFYGNVVTILLLLCPAVSMRMYAEERSKRTLELLMTSPLSTAEIVLGKFLGAMAFIAIWLVGLSYAPILMWFWSTPDPGTLFTAHVALLLVAATSVSIGALFSALTDNQITALVPSVCLGLALYVMGAWGDGVLEEWSILYHIDDMLLGGLRLSDFAYFVGVIGVFLFATHQKVESFRWS